MHDQFNLQDDVALITGGGSGIGLGIATCMIEAGARTVLVGRREAELAKACAKLGERAAYVAHDITELDQADILVTRAETRFGAPISILVNNAGTHLKRRAVDTTPSEFEAVLRTHVIAAHALTRAVLPSMLERRRGNILFTASMASYIGLPEIIAYSAAKSAYLGMVRTLASEVSSSGIRVNAIAPGWIDSAITRKVFETDPVRKMKVLGRTPMARMGDPEDVGWAAVYLCSPAAKFVTGATLPVDGGASIGF